MSLVNWRRQNARGSYPSLLDTHQLRRQEYGFIDLTLRNTDALMNRVNWDVIQGSWGAPATQIPVRNKKGATATIGSMTCVIPPVDSDDDFVAITFFRAFDSFRIIPRFVEQTDVGISVAEEFAFLSIETEENLADLLEAQIQTVINAAVATTGNSTFVGVGNKYPFLANALQVSQADIPFFFNDFKSIYQADNFRRNGIEIIGDAQLTSPVNEFINQGSGNATNTNFQFNGYTFTNSNTTTTSAAAFSTGFGMPFGTIGMKSRVSPDARAGRESNNGTKWMTLRSDLLGMEMEVMMTDGCSDLSATTGNADDTNTYSELWQYGIDVAIVTKYDTGTNNGIKKFDLLPV